MSQTEIELRTLGALPAAQIQGPSKVSNETSGTRETVSREANANASEDDDRLSRVTTAFIITAISCTTALGSLLAGLITVAIPQIAKDVQLGESLLLWPASIYALVSGCTLLISGSVADVIGSRTMYLTGCFLQTVFNLGTGLVQTGPQLIIFQGLNGLAISFCLPSAVSIITNNFAQGRRRNAAFACMGGGQPLGFAVGLTLGGVLTSTIGWRWGFHLASMLSAILLVTAVLTFPRSKRRDPVTWHRMISDIDWAGALIASSALATLSFVFASITTNSTSIRHPVNIVLLSISIALIGVFPAWISRQERNGRPALIPNSLWRSPVFTSVCICVFLAWGAFNAIEQTLTFYFQYLQGLSASQSAVRFLVEPCTGALTNIAMGFFIHRFNANVIIGVATLLSLVSPLLMALASPEWIYWAAAFPSLMLVSISVDCLFTVSNLVISGAFPPATQALAGGVFNTVAQIGKSVGLALSAVIANTVTQRASAESGSSTSPEALAQGYKAAFWYCFGLNIAVLVVATWGLRKVGKVGEKRD